MHGVSLDGSWGPKARNSLIFATPMERFARFLRLNMAQTKVVKMMLGPHWANLRERWGPLRRENMIQNGHIASPGTPWRGLGRGPGGPQRVHGLP